MSGPTEMKRKIIILITRCTSEVKVDYLCRFILIFSYVICSVATGSTRTSSIAYSVNRIKY